jgi:hypothetical protein
MDSETLKQINQIAKWSDDFASGYTRGLLCALFGKTMLTARNGNHSGVNSLGEDLYDLAICLHARGVLTTDDFERVFERAMDNIEVG